MNLAESQVALISQQARWQRCVGSVFGVCACVGMRGCEKRAGGGDGGGSGGGGGSPAVEGEIAHTLALC